MLSQSLGILPVHMSHACDATCTCLVCAAVALVAPPGVSVVFGDALQRSVKPMVTALSPIMRHDWALLQCSQGNSSTDFIWGTCRSQRLRTRPHQPSRKSVSW
jgi:hypothetical protein